MKCFKLYLPKNKINNINFFPPLCDPKNTRLFFYEGPPNCEEEFSIKILSLEKKIFYEGVIRKIFSPTEIIPITSYTEETISNLHDFSWGIAFEIDNIKF